MPVNMSIQSRSLSTCIHGCIQVALGIYTAWNEGRYLLKSGDNIYYNILMVGFLMMAYFEKIRP
jgi:hypothetical protein